MTATPIKYTGESNIFSKHGSTIGWVVTGADGDCFYDSFGMKKPRKSGFFGSKHATFEEAEATVRKVHAGMMKNTQIIGGEHL